MTEDAIDVLQPNGIILDPVCGMVIHCHIPHHTANNNVEEHGGGGLMLVIQVE